MTAARKQQLLARHRRRKRLLVLVSLLALLAVGGVYAWWLPPLLLLAGWIAHEAWFADHLFYSPRADYGYDFPAETPCLEVVLADGELSLSAALPAGETLILEVRLRSRLAGRLLDPYVIIGDDRQDFERAACGRRYLNLSGQAARLASGHLPIVAHHCTLAASARLYVLANPDYTQERLLLVAPHADDAELAAFGLYSRAREVRIVTLTQGEVEAGGYRRLGLDAAQAARLKGRLRTWDSLAVPLWGGVAQQHCVQLGYYCLQLPAMLAAPEQIFASRESGEGDIRPARRHNALALPADADGLPTGANLIADLVAVLEHFRPRVVVMPHPELDPHPDHVASSAALLQAIGQVRVPPRLALLYANHLHDNDRWPMGPAGGGIALPPALTTLPADGVWSPCLSPAEQLDKALALAMQHDLQGRLAGKARLRRLIQSLLAGRRWPATGDNEFFRKAVRRHELFWVRRLER
ncbi:MAG: PIG-L family deacetylase [Candidatus Accumulibacter sp.]|uniref:PIG-L deacetylase family protein n=1 Tax=Accumulibacter sp. TaxID=2053492 RepID=UPI002878DAB2|nr:PIG-L family deacetylase [Accumulibacter sp.]MDS4015521.1 PIG-L family deacetylase [Accumulibacter sp.]